MAAMSDGDAYCVIQGTGRHMSPNPIRYACRFERLSELESFRDYEAKVKAEAKAETKAATVADNLAELLILRGDAPSEHALNTISACHNSALLASWLKRANLGETCKQLVPEPKSPTS